MEHLLREDLRVLRVREVQWEDLYLLANLVVMSLEWEQQERLEQGDQSEPLSREDQLVLLLQADQ